MKVFLTKISYEAPILVLISADIYDVSRGFSAEMKLKYLWDGRRFCLVDEPDDDLPYDILNIANKIQARARQRLPTSLEWSYSTGAMCFLALENDNVTFEI